MRPGRRLALGDVEVELTAFASPCTKIRSAFISQMFKRISDTLNRGWSRVYARVLREGLLHAGARVTLSDE
jgi:MOSC domain-containing protein YiiM